MPHPIAFHHAKSKFNWVIDLHNQQAGGSYGERYGKHEMNTRGGDGWLAYR